MNHEIEKLIRRLVTEHTAAVEKACEAALQGGECGVLVIWHRNGDVSVGVDASVPYGFLYERREGQDWI